MSYSRNPGQMTFREVYSEFATGTLSSSSPASRRTGYMGFTHHRRQPDHINPKHSQSMSNGERHCASVRPRSAASYRSEVPKTNSVSSGSSSFEKRHSAMIHGYFANLLAALHEDGLCGSAEYGDLVSCMRPTCWERETLPHWITKYAEYVNSGDGPEFVRSLIRY